VKTVGAPRDFAMPEGFGAAHDGTPRTRHVLERDLLIERCAAPPLLPWREAVLWGEVDLLSAPALRDEFEEQLAEGARWVVLDCEHVDFFDASGVREFVRVDEALKAIGGRLQVCHPSPQIKKVLGITGFGWLVVPRSQ
jgi:anti-anti-sigma factor